MSARSAGWRSRFAASVSSRSPGQLTLRPEPVLPVRVVAKPASPARPPYGNGPSPSQIWWRTRGITTGRRARRGTAAKARSCGGVDVERALRAASRSRARRPPPAPARRRRAGMRRPSRSAPRAARARATASAGRPRGTGAGGRRRGASASAGGARRRRRTTVTTDSAPVRLEQLDRAGDVLGSGEGRGALDDRQRVEVAELLGARAGRTRAPGRSRSRAPAAGGSATTSSPPASARIASSSLETATVSKQPAASAVSSARRTSVRPPSSVEVLARDPCRAAARRHEAERPHATRSSSIMAAAPRPSSSQSGSRGSPGASTNPQCPSAESRSATGSKPVRRKKASAVSWVR